MTTGEMTAMLSTITGETDSNILSVYLDLAKSIVVNRAYPFGDGEEEVPSKYERVQVEIAAYLINKRGAEGEVTHTENGIIRQYENGNIPSTLLRRIVPMGKVL